MAVMAIDHASLFIAGQHFGEWWGLPLPDYGDPLSLLTRVVTHLCAPGFFFLMGVGMVLFAGSRRQRGWGEGRIARHFVLRGFLLIVVEVLVVNPAWVLGSFASEQSSGAIPGGGELGFFPVGVLAALGAAMVSAAFLARFRAPSLLLCAVVILIACQALLPSADEVAELHPLTARLLLVAGQTDFLIVIYPVAPWLGVSLLGMAWGHAIRASPERALAGCLPVGLLALLAFVAVRANGGFGTYHPAPGDDWMAFLSLTKYPPSAAFLLLSLGSNALLLYALARGLPALGRVGRPLLAFGRAPLFFYVAHLYLYALLGHLYPGNSSLTNMYAIWLLGLVLLHPACIAYDGFKRGKAEDSLWRLF